MVFYGIFKVLSQLPMKILPPRLPQQFLHLLRPLQLRGTGIGLGGRRDRQPRPRVWEAMNILWKLAFQQETLGKIREN